MLWVICQYITNATFKPGTLGPGFSISGVTGDLPDPVRWLSLARNNQLCYDRCNSLRLNT